MSLELQQQLMIKKLMKFYFNINKTENLTEAEPLRRII